MKLTVFYSWQMTTSETFNKDFIKNCIKSAINNIQNKGQLKGVNFTLEESTSNIPGSPDIPRVIEDRIAQCDIFIADLSIVNSYSWFEKTIRQIGRKQCQYFMNNNAYGEYNRALAAIGDSQVIAIMNTYYGDPQKNPSIIPFDTSHRRFPILYKCGNLKDVDTISKNLTNYLENAIRLSALSAIEGFKTKYSPFIRFSEHSKDPKNQERFFENEIILDIKQKIIENKNNIRLLGLSGLGKTRIVFEAFKKSEELSINYLYCDCYLTEEHSVLGAVEKIIKNKEKAYLVIDNCEEKLFDRILILKNRYQSNIPITTIYNQPEEFQSDKCEYILIPKSLDEIVNLILEKEATIIKDDMMPIVKEFSGGIPLMAVLLVKSIKDGEEYIGRLKNRDLLSKLLNAAEESNERRILQSFSLFDYIGFEDDLREQLVFIATNKNITSISGENDVIVNQFEEVYNKFYKREIFEKRGRFISIRPKTLALFLAAEWFENCSSGKLSDLINDIQNQPNAKILIESLCKQIQYLGYNDNAKVLFAKLLDINGPFDNAEVVNTELGSRLFRSFVEVNPIAVANNLYRLFGSMSIDQLKNVQEGRRNLVWTLEKLCFDKSTFEKGAKLMMAFGAAENETWGNNSTSEFLHLFKIQLAGTQANLSERLKIIKWGLKKGNEHTILSLKALSSALETQHFTRFLGAETQGTKKLEDYIPSNSEVIKYWTEVLDILEEYALSVCEYSSFCSEVIAEKARGLFRAGVANIILPKIKSIAERYSYDWDLMLDILYRIKEYEGPILKQELVSEIDTLIEQLTKTDFYSRFASVQKNRNKGESKLNFEEQIKIQKEEYQKLADEFVSNNFCSSEILHSIYSNKHLFSMPFGARIAELIEGNAENFNAFIETTLDLLLSIDSKDRNSSILIDFARGIKLEEPKNKLIESILSREQLSYLLFPVFGVFKKEDDELNILFSLVDREVVSIDEFKQYFNYLSLRGLSEDKFVGLCHKIKKYDVRGTDTVLSLIHSLLYFSKDINPNSVLYGLLEEILMSIDITNLNGINRDEYFHMIDTLLSHKESKIFAKVINLQVIELAKDTSYSFSFDYNLEKLYGILITKYFEEIWEDLSKALLSDGDDYFVYYHFQHLLGSQIGGVSNQVGILFSGNIELIFDWCKKQPDKAPSRLASMVPIFDGDGFHSIAKRLIDEYGENQEILNNLSSNMGSYSWVGSTIPLLESKKKLFTSLLNHSILEVVDWAKRYIYYTDREIEKERQREEEERFLYN